MPSFDLLLRIGFPIAAVLAIGLIAAARYADAGPIARLLHRLDPTLDESFESAGELSDDGDGRDRSSRNLATAVLLVTLVVYLYLHYYVLAIGARLPDDWLWPILTCSFAAALAIIFVGTRRFAGRLGVSKWSFWVAMLASIPVLLAIARYSRRPLRASLGGLILAWLLFSLIFKKLQLIDNAPKAPRQFQ